MCGIAGIVNTKKDIRKTILSLNLSIKHRGPDDSGYYYTSFAGGYDNSNTTGVDFVSDQHTVHKDNTLELYWK